MKYLLLFVLMFSYLNAEVSLERKIGQMVMVGFRGFTVEEDELLYKQIKDGEIGGVVLFDYDIESSTFVRNISCPDQLQILCDDLKRGASIPLFIAVDQEGGMINRLKTQYGFPATFSQKHLGLRNDPELCYEQGLKIAHTLKENGINFNLAPVVDLNLFQYSPCTGKKERSFSADPLIVAKFAEQIIHAHHERGIITALKHFPGHGSANLDTHDGFVDVSSTWSAEELKPFRNLIDAGIVDVIMTAHIYNANLDSKLPASLSHNTITKLLRMGLGYDGVVLSDDLQMGAIGRFYSLDETVRLAIESGVDILMFANQMEYDPEISTKIISIVKDLIDNGLISEERINLSYSRIMSLKAKYLKV